MAQTGWNKMANDAQSVAPTELKKKITPPKLKRILKKMSDDFSGSESKKRKAKPASEKKKQKTKKTKTSDLLKFNPTIRFLDNRKGPGDAEAMDFLTRMRDHSFGMPPNGEHICCQEAVKSQMKCQREAKKVKEEKEEDEEENEVVPPPAKRAKTESTSSSSSSSSSDTFECNQCFANIKYQPILRHDSRFCCRDCLDDFELNHELRKMIKNSDDSKDSESDSTDMIDIQFHGRVSRKRFLQAQELIQKITELAGSDKAPKDASHAILQLHRSIMDGQDILEAAQQCESILMKMRIVV